MERSTVRKAGTNNRKTARVCTLAFQRQHVNLFLHIADFMAQKQIFLLDADHIFSRYVAIKRELMSPTWPLSSSSDFSSILAFEFCQAPFTCLYSPFCFLCHDHIRCIIDHIHIFTRKLLDDGKVLQASHVISTLLIYDWSVQKTSKKPQTNQKHNRKGMWFGCEQPSLWGERGVTSQKTAAKPFFPNRGCLMSFHRLGHRRTASTPPPPSQQRHTIPHNLQN